MGGNSITLYVFQPRNNVEKERGGRSVMTPAELSNIDISVLLTIPL